MNDHAGDRPGEGGIQVRPEFKFWRLCELGQRPELPAFLSNVRLDNPRELAAVLRMDQCDRWSSGDRVPAESYFDAYPSLWAEADCTFELIYSEFLLREERGEEPTVHEYIGRFPEHGARLRMQIELHSAIDDLGPAGRETASCADSDGPLSLSDTRASGARPLPAIPGYEILGLLGRGAMGIVYRARQMRLNRLVALKMLLAGEFAHREHLARFRAEAEAAARLHHPNIVQIYDLGEHDGLPFLSLEYIEGGTLAEWLTEGPLAPRDAARLIATLARAIEFAHQRGIVHRDLKPANILLSSTNEGGSKEVGAPPAGPQQRLSASAAKIADFGLAKLVREGQSTQTDAGALLGTPNYMSPEQASGQVQNIGPAADIYALGAILYELLAGQPPFQAPSIIETLQLVLLSEPAAVPRLQPRDLATICLKCLQKDQHKRYSSAGDLAEDLERFLADQPIRARRITLWETGWRWRRRNPVTAGLMGFVAALLLLLAGGATTTALWLGRERDAALRNYKSAEKQRERAEASEKDAKTKAALAKAAQEEAHENLKDARAAVDQMLTSVADRLVAVPQMEQVRRELLEDALKFYQKVLEKKGDDPVLRQDTAWAFRRLAVIQRGLGQLVEAEQSYRMYFAMFEELQAQAPLEPSTRASLVRAHTFFAALRLELGDREEHEEHLRQAVRIAEDLVQEFPKDPICGDALVNANIHLITQIRHPPDQEEELLRRNLTLTKAPHLVGSIHLQLGHLRVRQERYAEAVKEFLKSLEVFESIASASPSWWSAQYDLGSVLLYLADAVAADGQGEKAEALYQRATAILDKVATDYPGFHHYRAFQAVAHYHYANFLKKLERTADAENGYRRAVALYEKLAADFATIPAYQQIAFDQRLELGRFLVAAGQAYDAQQIDGEAVALSGKRMADFPTRLQHWQGLVRSHIELGRLLERSGKTPAAEEAFGQAMVISEKLEAEHGGNPDYRREVARSHMDAAWLLRVDGRYSEAEKLYFWALEHYASLGSKSPRAKQDREDLAFAQFSLADHYRWAPGRLVDAEKVFRQAVEQYEKMSADFPDVPGYRITIADGRERLASVLLFQGRLQEADQGFKEALALAERLAKEHPADPTVRMPLAMGSRHWAETLRGMAQTAEAEKALRRSEAILEKLAADFPHESWYQLELGVTCQMLAALLARDLKQPQAAEEFYRGAVEIFEKLVAESPREPSHRRHLADAHRERALCLLDMGRTQEVTQSMDLAIANFSRAVEFGSNDLWGVWYPLALLHLNTGRTAEYRQLCEAMLERFGQANDPDFWVVIICKLAPDAVADLSRPVQMAEKLLAPDPQNADLVGVLGETLYRKGDLDAAIQRLEASIRAAPGVGIHWRRLFLAMAYHRLGRTSEAQSLVKETAQWMEKNARDKLADGAELSQPLPWQVRLDLQLLRHEAEELLKKIPTEPPAAH